MIGMELLYYMHLQSIISTVSKRNSVRRSSPTIVYGTEVRECIVLGNLLKELMIIGEEIVVEIAKGHCSRASRIENTEFVTSKVHH